MARYERGGELTKKTESTRNSTRHNIQTL